jgi:malate dehydrogenase
VPCIIGRNGVDSIIDIKLNENEQKKFNSSSDAVRKMNKSLQDILKK